LARKRPHRSPWRRHCSGFALECARGQLLEVSDGRTRRAVTVLEVAVLARTRRPGTVLGGPKRQIGSSAPSDRVSGVKPAPERSFSTIETSAESAENLISSTVAGRGVAVWASGVTARAVRCRGYLDLGTEATSPLTLAPNLTAIRQPTTPPDSPQIFPSHLTTGAGVNLCSKARLISLKHRH
jgi:hypothetical protein